MSSYSYPDEIATHNRTQALHIDNHGLVRRLDYNSEIFGGAPTAHLATKHEAIDGITFPLRREIVLRGQDGSAASGPVLIGMSFSEIEIVNG